MHVDYDRFIVCWHRRLHLDLKHWRQQSLSWSYIFVNKEFSHTILENLSLSSLWGEKDLIADEKIYHIYPKNVKSMKISSSVFIYYFANKISKPFLCNDYEMIETKPICRNTLKTPSSEWSLRVSGSAELVKSINQYFYSKFFSHSLHIDSIFFTKYQVVSLSLSFPECYLTSFLYQSGLSFFMKKFKLFSMNKII